MMSTPEAPAAPKSAEPGSPSAISDEEVSALLEKNGAEAVKVYDLTTQRINRTQLPMLEIVSKTFADRITTSLSVLLGRDATVQFAGLESAKAGELQVALPVPASLVIVKLNPLPGLAYVSVDPNLLLALLDGFFGGTGRATTDTQAAIAPAAQRFLALMLRSFAPDLKAAWTPVSAVELELVKQETNPRLMNLGGPQDPLLVLRFMVEFGARSGRMEWLLPEGILAPVREALAGEKSGAPVRKHEAWAPVIGTALQEAELEMSAILAQAQISLRELVKLTPGDIIPIETPQQVTLLVGETPLYRGRFGVSQGRNALKITPGGLA
jgi:flagellar motor switch protein FliM